MRLKRFVFATWLEVSLIALCSFFLPEPQIFAQVAVHRVECAPLQNRENVAEKRCLAGRVLARLLQAEFTETDAWMRDDIRIARVTVALAARGEPEPHLSASYQVLGLHPDLVWPAIIARRKTKLGKFYSDFYDEGGNLRRGDLVEELPIEPVPKKPPHSLALPPRIAPQIKAA